MFEIDDQTAQVLLKEVRTLDEAYALDNELRIVYQQSFSIVPEPAKAKASQKSTTQSNQLDNNTTNQKTDGNRNTPLANKIKDHVSVTTYGKIHELETKGIISLNKPDELRAFFESVHNLINRTPRLQLQIAVDLNMRLVTDTYEWVEKHFNQKVFLEVVVKPQLLAGCIIIYKGVYKDFSLRTVLMKRKEDIFSPIMQKLDQKPI